MLKISAGQFIDSTVMQGVGNDGMPEAQITIEGNWELIQMQNDIQILMTKMDSIVYKEAQEERLLRDNPALKDIHDQYKVVYQLVKKADDDSRCNGGG